MTSRFKRNGLNKPKTNGKKKTVPNNGNGNGKLTPAQKIFCDEWLIDRNGTRAWKVAYPNISSDNMAASQASIAIRKLKIKAYIDARLELISEKAEINQDWVLKRYKMLADFCISDFFFDDGKMKPFSMIPKDSLYAIGGFKQSKKTITTQDKQTITDRIREFKLADKKSVLDSIGRFLGMDNLDNDNRQGQVQIAGQNIQVNLIRNEG